MPLNSMTGFARAQGHADCGTASGEWVWELRSVNSRNLDMRFRLPPGIDGLEAEARKIFAAKFNRGSIQAALQFSPQHTESTPVVNEAALEAVLGALENLRSRLGSPPPAAEAVLAIRGILEPGGEAALSGDAARRETILLGGLEDACATLAQARAAEGEAIAEVLHRQVEGISELVKRVDADPSRTPQAIAARLKAQLEPLLGDTALDVQRLHQEAALLAVKSDLSEEIDRLKAHVAAAVKLFADKGPVGRKLDFLSQEFNRECNTICSKANAAAVTEAGLEMKVLIDRFREQVQNIE